MTLQPTIRLLCAATLAVALITPATAQTTREQTQVVADPFATREDARFRTYPTYRSETQLLLDTTKGQLWQVEYTDLHAPPRSGGNEKTAAAGRYLLGDNLPANGTPHRFALVNRDLGQYSLLDQDTGTIWHVWVMPGAPERSIFRKLEDVPLPDVEAP